jgi:hypothetical protein
VKLYRQLMEGFKIGVMLGLLAIMIPSSYGVSVSCMMAYDEGGVFAVLESPECSEWVLSAGSPQNQTVNCQSATLQGHREYQEDRIVCHLHMKILLLGIVSLLKVTIARSDFICSLDCTYKIPM